MGIGRTRYVLQHTHLRYEIIMMGLSLSLFPFLLPPRPNGIEDTERELYLQFSIYFSFFVAPNRYRKSVDYYVSPPVFILYRYVFSIFPSLSFAATLLSHGNTAFKKPMDIFLESRCYAKKDPRYMYSR